jgi:hypothetical protein
MNRDAIVTPSEFINAVCERSVAVGVMDISKVRGWSDEEIAAAETALALRLPTYYRQFLRVLGKSGGGLMLGTHIFPKSPDDFPGWRRLGTRLMAASGAALPDDAVVFGDHQGYQFWYFLAGDASEDPPVFYYHEGEKEPRQVSDSFTAFVLNMVEEGRRDKEWGETWKARAEAARAAFRAEHGGGRDPESDGVT